MWDDLKSEHESWQMLTIPLRKAGASSVDIGMYDDTLSGLYPRHYMHTY